MPLKITKIITPKKFTTDATITVKQWHHQRIMLCALIYNANHTINTHYTHIRCYTISSTTIKSKIVVHLIDRLIDDFRRADVITCTIHTLDSFHFGKTIQMMLGLEHFQFCNTLQQLSILLSQNTILFSQAKIGRHFIFATKQT